MTTESRQAISDACAAVLRELDDLRPDAACTNADLVAAIDSLIVARLNDMVAYVWESYQDQVVKRQTP